MQKFERGAEWRKWDLQVHSPASVLNNQFAGQTQDEKWDHYFSALEKLEGISVIGITDYFSIEGYKKVKANFHRLKNIDLILPNVELRVLPTTTDGRAINLHIIFSPEVIEEVEARFFPSLEFRYDGDSYKCVREDLIRLGRKFLNNARTEEDTAYKTGIEQFKISIDQIKDIFNRNESLKNNSIIVVSNGSRDGNSGIQHSSLAATREEIYRAAHCIFSANPSDQPYFLGKDASASPEEIKRKYRSFKPCIHGSDAHSLDKIGKPDLDRFTWIKADPTFKGLEQVIIEPEDRVFIGTIPPKLKLVDENKTKYINQISIIRKPEADTEQIWFKNIQLPLNAGLVAIIGNKGNGKSALAEIIGLAANTRRFNSFSFLHKDKFREHDNRLSRHFVAKLTWWSGDNDEASLDEDPEDFEKEKVNYIPQQYLDKICNEAHDQFENEIKQVIFSHVREEDKLQRESLDDLIRFRSEELDEKIQLVYPEIAKFNQRIIEVESKLTEEHEKSLLSILAEKRRELESHLKGKPTEVSKPAATPEAQQAIEKVTEEIRKNEALLAELQIKKLKLIDEQKELKLKTQQCKKVIGKIHNFEASYKNFREDLANDLTDLNIPIESISTASFNAEPIKKVQVVFETRLNAIEKELDVKNIVSIAGKIDAIDKIIVELRSKLDTPNQKYQAYLKALKEWDDKRKVLEGNEHELNTIKYIEKQLNEIKNILPFSLKELREQRLVLAGRIYDVLLEKIEIYRELYKPIEKFIEEQPISKEELELKFSATTKEKGLLDWFFAYITQQVKGTYSGQGYKPFQKLLGETDFNNKQSTLEFLSKLIHSLEHDMRDEVASGEKKREIAKQLRKNKKDTNEPIRLVDFYDYLFTLQFLDPSYSLKLGDKNLSQLSPGERGGLLLIFYLLIDRDDIPLIIDQPEENLDNQSVFKMLVPAIKLAKRRRQIIIVTHNPNLAVVCDAEQVVRAFIHKTENNRVEYRSGSIENPVINKDIVDVLEGTMPAFRTRESKYEIEAL